MTSKIVVNNIEADSGINTITFINEVTAPTFNGNIVGTAATFSGNVDIAGALTYEDVTNVDSVGIVTARSGIHVTGGLVGIGTNIPNAPLHVEKDGTSQVLARFESNMGTNNNRSISINSPTSDSGSEPFIFNTGNGYQFQTDDQVALHINYNRNIGIGTDNPTEKLSVGGADSYLNNHGIGVLKPHSIGLKNGVFVYTDAGYNQSGSYRAAAFKAVGTSGHALGISTDAGSDALGGTQNAYINFDGSAYFAGRLLLGTTTEGAVNADNFTVADSGNCGITIRSGTSNSGNLYFSDTTSGTGEFDGAIAYDQNDQRMMLYTASTERLRITSSGRVSIGNDPSPKAPLHIKGEYVDQAPVTGVGTGSFVISNSDTAYGINFGVRSSGTGWIQQTRVDGTGANYSLLLNPLGGNIGIGTDVPTSDLHVFRSTSASSIVDAAAGDALLTLRNAGNTNWSGINFTRERSTGTNVTGGSIWMPSDTANNSATLYIQTQSASANAGESGALTDNNGVRLKLASQPGGSGPNSAFTVEVGSTEKFRILSDGQFETNGVRNIYETFRLRNDTTYNWDYTVPNEGGYGNSFYLVAGYNHYYTAAYGAHRTVWFSSRGTSVNAMGSGIEQSHSQAGSWTFSKPDSTTVRITKTSGTYGGQGYGFFHLMYNHF